MCKKWCRHRAQTPSWWRVSGAARKFCSQVSPKLPATDAHRAGPAHVCSWPLFAFVISLLTPADVGKLVQREAFLNSPTSKVLLVEWSFNKNHVPRHPLCPVANNRRRRPLHSQEQGDGDVLTEFWEVDNQMKFENIAVTKAVSKEFKYLRSCA
jgi:hypothetical protein